MAPLYAELLNARPTGRGQLRLAPGVQRAENSSDQQLFSARSCLSLTPAARARPADACRCPTVPLEARFASAQGARRHPAASAMASTPEQARPTRSASPLSPVPLPGTDRASTEKSATCSSAAMLGASPCASRAMRKPGSSR
eukprot:CAMPEP_0168478880 /NCGR_PEP_ID=MMETSP0228-20121227/63184_1 /TAXON_ID=133427 /ORGANISM="Protoceratium reticulatum, Strain CCCM 535 (=CCMP 1889)" /LENGTH=141 /DNA_ID=CAMNT_0008495151 /DNA_START=29 /DNA_END=450 /DNA_ORIENTATION=+